MNDMKKFAVNQREKCDRLLENFNESNFCPPNYDGTYCWPATPCRSAVRLPCPIYEQKNKSISRWCSANIKQITNSSQTIFEWQPSNSTECATIDSKAEANFLQPFPTPIIDVIDEELYHWHIKLYVLVKIGYVISIISLLIALSIFTLLRRLQNTRVRIHINLFISLALEAFMSLLQGTFYGHLILLSLVTEDISSNDNASLPCRILMVFGSYFGLTCFTWISMESWYFYCFICRAPYKGDARIKPLMIAAWGLPILIIIPYIITYSLTSYTNFCWVDVDVKANILAIPILIMVLINLCLFIVSVRVVFIKLNCSVLRQRQRHFWKWVKSTLMLVPLFGAHDIFFSVETWIEDKWIKTYFYNAVRIVCAFQGCIVSTLYCFMNNEVKSEIKRAWNNWKSKREIECNFVKQQYNRDFRSEETSTSSNNRNNNDRSESVTSNTNNYSV